nr:hypothetical protein [Tanacetum cinerariifolium]
MSVCRGSLLNDKPKHPFSTDKENAVKKEQKKIKEKYVYPMVCGLRRKFKNGYTTGTWSRNSLKRLIKRDSDKMKKLEYWKSGVKQVGDPVKDHNCWHKQMLCNVLEGSNKAREAKTVILNGGLKPSAGCTR